MVETFLLQTFKGGNDWLTGFDVFRITRSLPQLVRYVVLMNEITRLQSEHPEWDLHEFRIWDAGEWLPGDYDADYILDVNGEEIPPPRTDYDEDLSRTESDLADVGCDGITWTAVPKDTDADVVTGTLRREFLESIIHAAALEAAKETP